MTICHNPSLSEEPRNQPIKVVPQIAQESFLSWLENAGRLKPYVVDEVHDHLSEDLADFLEPEIQIPEDEESID